MIENPSDLDRRYEQQVDRDALPENKKMDTGSKRQVGRPPARPPYEHLQRASRVFK